MSTDKQKQRMNQIKMGVVAALALVVILFPKPQQIIYKYGNLTAESTYWDGLGGSGKLFDAQAEFVKLDEDTGYLNVCYSLQDEGSCVKYQVLENKGFFGYLGTLLPI